MGTFAPTLPLGSVTLQAITAADLGNLYAMGPSVFRVVKATSAITSPQYKALVTAVSSGVPTWNVATSTTANDYLAAGVVSVDYVADIAAGAYFLLQVAGPTKGVSAAAIAAGVPIGCSTTAGKIDDASITAGVGAMGISLESAAGADENPDIYLKGLI